jgi:hypothetical protein
MGVVHHNTWVEEAVVLAASRNHVLPEGQLRQNK